MSEQLLKCKFFSGWNSITTCDTCTPEIPIDFETSYLEFKYSPTTIGYLHLWLKFDNQALPIILPGTADGFQNKITWPTYTTTDISDGLVTDSTVWTVKVKEDREIVISSGDFTASVQIENAASKYLLHMYKSCFIIWFRLI